MLPSGIWIFPYPNCFIQINPDSRGFIVLTITKFTNTWRIDYKVIYYTTHSKIIKIINTLEPVFKELKQGKLLI